MSISSIFAQLRKRELLQQKVHRTGVITVIAAKVKDYVAFSKPRLTSLVVFSAVICYLLAVDTVLWDNLIVLILGGYMITASSNGFNQIIERDLDKLMNRTKNRPLPTGRMSLTEAYILSFSTGIIGLVALWSLNELSAWMGLWALLIYALLYTPLKRITPWGVLVGAIPGAIPPMLGWIAATGEFGLIPGILFFVQFMWQFPHFWAIAWKLHDDYNKAGFKMLPSGAKDRSSAFQIVVYSIFMIPASLLPFIFGVTGYISGGICLLIGIWFLSKSVKLFKSMKDEDATKVMFASFIYLPVVLLSYLIDKL